MCITIAIAQLQYHCKITYKLVKFELITRQAVFCLANQHEQNFIHIATSKPFDKVPHKRLLAKIELYGIRGRVLKWLESFLSNYSQVVTSGSFYSACEVISGPILFLLYINDITEGNSSEMKFFADDCLIYKVIHSTVDHQTLQQDFTTLSKWADKWQMAFNIISKKFEPSY